MSPKPAPAASLPLLLRPCCRPASCEQERSSRRPWVLGRPWRLPPPTPPPCRFFRKPGQPRRARLSRPGMVAAPCVPCRPPAPRKHAGVFDGILGAAGPAWLPSTPPFRAGDTCRPPFFSQRPVRLGRWDAPGAPSPPPSPASQAPGTLGPAPLRPSKCCRLLGGPAFITGATARGPRRSRSGREGPCS